MDRDSDRVLQGSVRVIMYHNPADYPPEQLDEAFSLAYLLGRGDFHYIEEPRTS